MACFWVEEIHALAALFLLQNGALDFDPWVRVPVKRSDGFLSTRDAYQLERRQRLIIAGKIKRQKGMIVIALIE